MMTMSRATGRKEQSGDLYRDFGRKFWNTSNAEPFAERIEAAGATNILYSYDHDAFGQHFVIVSWDEEAER